MDSIRTFRRLPMDGRGISRRSFLAGLGVAAAAGALLAIEGQLPAIEHPPVASGMGLRRSLFAGYVGAIFQAHADAANLPLRLIDVQDLHAASYQHPAVDREQNFALLFHSPLNKPLDQGTYHIAHGRIGSFPLFIVPVQHNQQATYYEAIFSR